MTTSYVPIGNLSCISFQEPLERQPDRPILGMQKYNKGIKGPKFFYSGNKNSLSKSISHGGFDNDPDTLNHIMTTIRGKKPTKPFTLDEMEGF